MKKLEKIAILEKAKWAIKYSQTQKWFSPWAFY